MRQVVRLLTRVLISTVLLVATFAAASAQTPVRVESEPPTWQDRFLLRITQEWPEGSPLGTTLGLQLSTNDIELRVWSGYGITGTRGIILRRIDGTWRGWSAIVHRCSSFVPIPVADTASAATLAAFRERARRECGGAPRGPPVPARVFTVDTLETKVLGPEVRIADAWDRAVNAGVLELPPQIQRTWMMADGFTYVVELRRGSTYRASVIEHVNPPEVEADRQVQAVYRAVTSLLRCSPPPK